MIYVDESDTIVMFYVNKLISTVHSLYHRQHKTLEAVYAVLQTESARIKLVIF